MRSEEEKEVIQFQEGALNVIRWWGWSRFRRNWVRVGLIHSSKGGGERPISQIGFGGGRLVVQGWLFFLSQNPASSEKEVRHE